MTLRAVDVPAAGPIDADLRAMIERVIARRPLAAMILFETAADLDFDHVPRMDTTRLGFLAWVKEGGADHQEERE